MREYKIQQRQKQNIRYKEECFSILIIKTLIIYYIEAKNYAKGAIIKRISLTTTRKAYMKYKGAKSPLTEEIPRSFMGEGDALARPWF